MCDACKKTNWYIYPERVEPQWKNPHYWMIECLWALLGSAVILLYIHTGISI